MMNDLGNPANPVFQGGSANAVPQSPGLGNGSSQAGRESQRQVELAGGSSTFYSAISEILDDPNSWSEPKKRMKDLQKRYDVEVGIAGDSSISITQRYATLREVCFQRRMLRREEKNALNPVMVKSPQQGEIEDHRINKLPERERRLLKESKERKREKSKELRQQLSHIRDTSPVDLGRATLRDILMECCDPDLAPEIPDYMLETVRDWLVSAEHSPLEIDKFQLISMLRDTNELRTVIINNSTLSKGELKNMDGVKFQDGGNRTLNISDISFKKAVFESMHLEGTFNMCDFTGADFTATTFMGNILGGNFTSVKTNLRSAFVSESSMEHCEGVLSHFGESLIIVDTPLQEINKIIVKEISRDGSDGDFELLSVKFQGLIKYFCHLKNLQPNIDANLNTLKDWLCGPFSVLNSDGRQVIEDLANPLELRRVISNNPFLDEGVLFNMDGVTFKQEATKAVCESINISCDNAVVQNAEYTPPILSNNFTLSSPQPIRVGEQQQQAEQASGGALNQGNVTECKSAPSDNSNVQDIITFIGGKPITCNTPFETINQILDDELKEGGEASHRPCDESIKKIIKYYCNPENLESGASMEIFRRWLISPFSVVAREHRLLLDAMLNPSELRKVISNNPGLGDGALCNMDGVTFANKSIELTSNSLDISFHEAKFHNMQVNNANLTQCRGARFDKSTLISCNFSEGDIVDTSFSECDLDCCSFYKANITGVRISSCKIINCDFYETSLDEAEVSDIKEFEYDDPEKYKKTMHLFLTKMSEQASRSILSSINKASLLRQINNLDKALKQLDDVRDVMLLAVEVADAGYLYYRIANEYSVIAKKENDQENKAKFSGDAVECYRNAWTNGNKQNEIFCNAFIALGETGPCYDWRPPMEDLKYHAEKPLEPMFLVFMAKALADKAANELGYDEAMDTLVTLKDDDRFRSINKCDESYSKMLETICQTVSILINIEGGLYLPKSCIVLTAAITDARVTNPQHKIFSCADLVYTRLMASGGEEEKQRAQALKDALNILAIKLPSL